MLGSLALAGDLDIGQRPRESRVPGIFGVDERDSVLEVQGIDHVAIALMQIHRPGVDRRGCLPRSRAAHHAARSAFQNRDLSTGGAPDVDLGMWIDSGSGEVATRSPAKQPVIDHRARDRFRIPRPHLGVGQRKFGGGTQ